MFGAALVPLSQSVLLGAYPKERQGSAVALWGMAVMVGPILGPILGECVGDVRSRQFSEPLSGTSRTGLWRNQNGNWTMAGRDSHFKAKGWRGRILRMPAREFPLEA